MMTSPQKAELTMEAKMPQLQAILKMTIFQSTYQQKVKVTIAPNQSWSVLIRCSVNIVHKAQNYGPPLRLVKTTSWD